MAETVEDIEQEIQEVIEELQQTDRLYRLLRVQYSPRLLEILHKRLEQNLEIESDLREWARLNIKQKYPMLVGDTETEFVPPTTDEVT